MKNILLSVLFLSLFSVSFAASRTVKLEPFTGIVAKGNFKVIVKKGDENKVVMDGDNDAFYNIKIKVKGNGLADVKSKNEPSLDKGLTLTFYYTGDIVHLEVRGEVELNAEDVIESTNLKLKCMGGGKITSKLDVENLTTDIKNKGEMNLSGYAGSHTSSIFVGGDIHAFDMKNKTTTAVIREFGTIEISPTDKLDAKAMNGGKIYYSTDPSTVLREVVVEGTIRQKSAE